MDYGVEHKLLPGSDFPSGTMDNVIAGLRNINKPVEGTNLPKIPIEVQDAILYENWKAFFPVWNRGLKRIYILLCPEAEVDRHGLNFATRQTGCTIFVV